MTVTLCGLLCTKMALDFVILIRGYYRIDVHTNFDLCLFVHLYVIVFPESILIRFRACFGSQFGLPSLMRTLEDRKAFPIPKSYTNRLLNEPELLGAKIKV